MSETNRYANMVKHIETISRRQITNNRIYDDEKHSELVLRDLLSQRKRSTKDTLIALFTTKKRFSKFQNPSVSAKFGINALFHPLTHKVSILTPSINIHSGLFFERLYREK
jgi:hypothetical protein